MAVLFLNGLEYGDAMFSGMMTVVVLLTGLVALFGVVLAPFYVMGLYPADGLAAAGPAMSPEPGTASPQPMTDDDDDDFNDDGFGEEESFEDDEQYDDSYDDEYDDSEEDDGKW